MRQERPVTVEVLAYAPVAFFHCLHCELIWEQAGMGLSYRREQLESSIPDDLKREYQRLSDWVRRMIGVYGSKLEFKIIDVASIEGWVKSVRYGVRDYPAVIVDRKEKTFGADWERATELIERRLRTLRA